MEDCELMSARLEWLEQRRQGIGGSDCAVVMGLSKWKSSYQLYLEKRGEVSDDQPDNEAMLWGRELEPVIRQQYANRTGRLVRADIGIIKSPEYPFMLANVDGLTEDQRVLEIKTARTASGWGEEGTDQVPEAYLLQVQHYMAVTGLPVADVAVLIGGSDFRIYEVPANPELHELIIEAEAEFWRRVVDGNPPEITSYADAVAKYGKSTRAGEIEARPRALEAIQEIRTIKGKIDELEKIMEFSKAILINEFGDQYDTMTHKGLTVATWKKPRNSVSFDTAAFKAAHQDLYDAYSLAKESSRRLLIK